MKDDPSLRDEQLEGEIRLVGDLVLAASQSVGPLSQDAIDEILGLDPTAQEQGTAPGSASGESAPSASRAS